MLPESRAPSEVTLFPEPVTGTVEEAITPTQPGRVRFQATSWPARLYNSDDRITLTPESAVSVVGRQGITALVVPESYPDEIIPFSQPGTGTVEEAITPTQPGRVRFQATSWPARLYNPEAQVTLEPNDSVDVVARQNITLLVVPSVSPQDSVRSPQPEQQEDSRMVEDTTDYPQASRESNSYFFDN